MLRDALTSNRCQSKQNHERVGCKRAACRKRL